MDIFEKLFAVIVLAIALFIVPFVFLSTAHDSTTESVVYSITSDFTESVKTQGKITQDMYLDFTHQLDNTGLLYKIEMKHCHFSVVPIFDSDGKTVKGTSSHEQIYYTDQILDKIFTGNDVFNNEGIYAMSMDDTFTITVTNADETMGQIVRRMVFGLPETASAVYVVCGGTIRDENY